MKRPPSVLVERLGQSNAEALIAKVGGTRLHVPGQVANGARLANLLGYDLAVLVILHFGDSRISVPLSLRGQGAQGQRLDMRKLRRLVRAGLSAPTIARRLGCSERTIYAKRAQLSRAKPSKGL